MTRSIEDLLDKEEIREVLFRYCRGVDRLEPELIRSCYHPDAYDDHGVFRGSVDEFVAYAAKHLETMERTMHCLHNITIELRGDRAGSETYCVAYHRMSSRHGGRADHLVGLRYADAFERRDGGPWLIARRTVVYEWSRIDEVCREWTMQPHYARGRRDPHDASYELVGTAGAGNAIDGS